MDTMPAGRPSWTTGMRRTLCSRTIPTASSTDWSTVRLDGSRVHASPTLVLCGSRPSATTRTAMSRSVRMPVTLPLSVTSTAPTSPSAICRAASTTLSPGSTGAGRPS